jgi:hypothetical protein
MKTKQLPSTIVILLICFLVGGFLRFYKLNWGESYFFHPDEGNIAGSVSQLKFPTQMNPNFYAYGSFPVYLFFFLTKLYLLVKSIYIAGSQDLFTQSILVGRFISASVSVLSLITIFTLVRQIGKWEAWGTLLLSIFSVGLIQYSHFSTVESLQVFLYLLLFLSLHKWSDQRRKRWFLLSGIIFGISIATKITSIIFLPVCLIFLLNFDLKIRSVLNNLARISLYLAICLVTVFMFFPYALLDFEQFKGSIKYESDVAYGKLKVFYTRQYTESEPVIWQFRKTLPWSLGLFATAMLPIAWVGTLADLARRLRIKKRSRLILGIWLWVTIFFFWHAFLFVKWIRYLIPFVPFANILISVFLLKVMASKGNLSMWVGRTLFTFILVGNIFQTVNFFKIYTLTDTRVAASNWASLNIKPTEQILSEVYDLGVIAMPPFTIPNTQLFNFYDLDTQDGPKRLEDLANGLAHAEWILVPSRRSYANIMGLHKMYPLANSYYKNLFNGSLGFTKLHESKVDTFFDDRAEETYQVFDHPKLMLFKKTKNFTSDQYQLIIKNYILNRDYKN